ncbi:MAG: hypothetical protein ABW250_26860 [Pyrinomonadaceae bacterium]
MPENPTTEGDTHRPTRIEEGIDYRVSYSIEVTARLYQVTPEGARGDLIADNGEEFEAARRGHAAAKAIQVMYGLFALLYLTSYTEPLAFKYAPVDFDRAFGALGELGLELSDSAAVRVSELLDLYEKKGEGDVRS